MTRSILLLLACVAMPQLSTVQESDPPGSCHVGAYAMSDGSQLTITPSDAPHLRYRSLAGASGRLYSAGAQRYESGDGWAVHKPVTLRVAFGSCEEGIIRFQREHAAHLEGRKIRLPTIPIRFASSDVTLYGELVKPLGRAPRAVVVLQYGSGRDSAVTYNFLQHLLPLKDIAVFVFDKRGTGRSTGSYSIHIGMLADDMAAAVRAVRTRSELKGVPLGLVGESQGGWVAPLTASKLAGTEAPVDFVVASYGLAVSMLEEDRMEVEQSLRAHGYGADVLARGEELHRAAARVMLSRFAEGLDELERLKAAWRDEPWLQDVGGDFTNLLTSTPAERMSEVQALVDFPYDLAYDPLPTLGEITVPQLWILAGKDTEAPNESTLAILRELEAEGLPIEVVAFPNAEHGMVEVEDGPEGPRLAGRYAEGYFDLLFDWIHRQGTPADRP